MIYGICSVLSATERRSAISGVFCDFKDSYSFFSMAVGWLKWKRVVCDRAAKRYKWCAAERRRMRRYFAFVCMFACFALYLQSGERRARGPPAAVVEKQPTAATEKPPAAADEPRGCAAGAKSQAFPPLFSRTEFLQACMVSMSLLYC